MIFNKTSKRELFLDKFIKLMEKEGRSIALQNDVIAHKSWCINFVISQLRQYETELLGRVVMDDKQLRNFAEEAVDGHYLFCNLKKSDDIRLFASQLFNKYNEIANKKE